MKSLEVLYLLEDILKNVKDLENRVLKLERGNKE